MSSPAAKDIPSLQSDQVTLPQIGQGETQSKQSERLVSFKIGQDSLLAVIEEQKKYIDQLEVSKAKALEEVQDLTSKNKGIDFSVWVSILLASVAVIVTVFGLMLAIISFVGYRNFKENTKEAAEKISEDTAADVARDEVNKQINEVAKSEIANLIDSGELKVHLESAIDAIYRKNKLKTGVGFDKYPEIDEDEL